MKEKIRIFIEIYSLKKTSDINFLEIFKKREDNV